MPAPSASLRRATQSAVLAATIGVALILVGCVGGTFGPASGGSDAPDPGASLDTDISIPTDAWPAVVTYVHDGDTLYLSGSGRSEEKTRLIGIDTPEIGEHAECYGAEATELTRAFLPEGTAVLATNDLDQYDPYDRELVYLWLEDGTFVNLAIIKLGGAEAVLFEPNGRYWDELRAAEHEAQALSLGMWGSCN